MERACCRCSAVTALPLGRRQFCLWAGLLLILVGPSHGRPEEAIVSGEDRRNILLPLPQAGTYTYTSFNRHTPSERYERDIADISSGSSSGSGELSPEPTPTPPILSIPTVYIEIYLRITLGEYLNRMQEIEDAIRSILLAILLLEDNTQPVMHERVTNGESEDEIIVQLNEGKSSVELTVVQIYVIHSESGEQNIYGTKQLYNSLESEYDKFASQLKNITNIEVIGVNFVEDDPQMNSTELRWWDIFVITLGCLAASACPIIVCLAVSYATRTYDTDAHAS